MRVLIIFISLLLVSVSKAETSFYLKCTSHPEGSSHTQDIQTFKIENKTISLLGSPLLQNIPLTVTDDEYIFEYLFQGKNVNTGTDTQISYSYRIDRRTGGYNLTTYWVIKDKLPDINSYRGSCEKVNDRKF